MKPSLVDHLRCTSCRSHLDLAVEETERGEVRTGRLSCRACKKVFPIQRFVPRFVDADKYADSFSRQRLYVRRHFEHYRKDKSGDAQFFPTTGFEPADLSGGLTLEIGCGYGRFIDVVQRAGGRIVGVDLSTHSIELAHDFVGFRENVFLVQADLFALPFDLASFQNVYSIGVLHHTPDTRAAFEALVPYVRSGGKIAIWVYHPQEKVIANWWRKVTTKLDHRLLYAFCIVNQALFSWIRALPGGWRFNWVIPGAIPKRESSFWMRVLGDFDSLSPTYAHVHDQEEVTGWFKNVGLLQIRTLSRRTAVTAGKP